MKIKAINAIVRQRKMLTLIDGKDRTQWISVGKAVYPLYGMPELDEMTVLRVLDVPEKDWEKIIVRRVIQGASESFADADDSDRLIEDAGITIGYGGDVLLPVRTSLGLRFINPLLLRPTEDRPCELYERETADGEIQLAVKAGLCLMALIVPLEINEEDIEERLDTLHREIVQTISLRRMREREQEEDIGQFAIDPETGEVLE